ncbi:MAG: hypothetical protein KF829_07705 [Ferruginibacter sp.]|nr:hypothetical protein [Ferruginibacter sp.]
MESITLDDLLQYLYKETSPEKTAAITAALEKDYNLREKLNVMAAASKRLDALKMSPRQDTIDKIMQYAEKNIEELSH